MSEQTLYLLAFTGLTIALIFVVAVLLTPPDKDVRDE